MSHHKKRVSLLLLNGALFALILLSASLSNLQLRGGTPFPSGNNSGPDIWFYSDLTSINIHFPTLLKGFFAFVLLILMIYVPARLVALVNLKKIIQVLLVISTIFIVIGLVSSVIPDWTAHSPGKSTGIAAPFPLEHPVAPLGKPPQILTWFVLIGFVIGMGFLVYKMFRAWSSPIRMEAQILEEAESAVNSIVAGGDLRNAIIRCYWQMTCALHAERKINRRYNMTVREFEEWLEFNGFPTIPVHQLTSLFEKVRYGTQPVVKEDEKMAIESLNEIIKFCRSERS